MTKMQMGGVAAVAVVVIGGGLFWAAQPKKTAAPTGVAQVAQARGEKFTVDTSASKVEWKGKKALVASEHFGTVNMKSGEVFIENGAVTAGTFVLDMTTIADQSVSDAKMKANLETHLKSDDFFGVTTHPEARFEISSVSSGTVKGNLTIKGITNQVEFPATITVSGNEATAQATMQFDRSMFDVRFGSGKFFENLGNNLIDDMISITLNVVAKK